VKAPKGYKIVEYAYLLDDVHGIAQTKLRVFFKKVKTDECITGIAVERKTVESAGQAGEAKGALGFRQASLSDTSSS
jgi:hypothetical protein